MEKVATPSAMPPSSRGISSVPLKGASIAKRKTPSELRGEQLKRDIFVDYTDESPTSAGSSKAAEVGNRFKKPGLFKAPRYNDTQLDDVFSAKKPRFIIRRRVLQSCGRVLKLLQRDGHFIIFKRHLLQLPLSWKRLDMET
ncbi:uncharacterized protein LOC131611901 [Vicia villosa]|uniref:uncharacterized protein LOC131611901 n=1 Tax=Vicia villosa TaxID=3911 RepID=UPI00273C92A0|nr:uncharacterized protein LOC131611901 [Vicia villosa]